MLLIRKLPNSSFTTAATATNKKAAGSSTSLKDKAATSWILIHKSSTFTKSLILSRSLAITIASKSLLNPASVAKPATKQKTGSKNMTNMILNLSWHSWEVLTKWTKESGVTTTLSNKISKFNSRPKMLDNEDKRSTLVSWVTLSLTLETTTKRISREPTILRRFSHFQSTQLSLTKFYSQIKDKMSLKK